MKLYKRADLYYCQHADPVQGRIRFSCGTSNKQEALEYAIKRLATPKLASNNTTDVLTLLTAIRSRETSLEHSKYYKNCYRYHRQLLSYFKEDFNLFQLQAVDVLKYHSYLKGKYRAPSTRNKYYLALSSVLRHAREDMGIDVPQIKFKLEKIKHSRKYIYTSEQITDIISFYQDNNDCFMRDLIIILADTGCRLSEALNINVLTDVRDSVLTVTINKADLPRSIPLTPRCIDVLKDRKDFQELNIDQVQRRFKSMKRTLSLSREATLHGLRHTFATRLVTKGASIDVVQNLLGHKNIQTTLIYAQITNVRLQDTMELLQS